MNSLLHRLIPALLSLSLPFSLQATEAETTDMPESAAMTQAQTTADEAGTTTETVAAQSTTPESAEAGEPMAEEALELPTEATTADVSATATTTAAAEPADESFAITSFEVTGNLLLPVETIEKSLQRFIGESRSRDDLFSIRHAVIKLYRSHDLDGVAVAVPTPGEAGLLEVKIFEDDIDAYPQQSAKAESAVQPENITKPAAESEAASSKKPRTYAIKLDPVEKPAVVVLPEPEPELTVEAESGAPADLQKSTATVESLLAEDELSETAEVATAEIKKPVMQKAKSEASPDSDAKEAIAANSPSPKVKSADTVLETTAPEEKVKAVAKSAAKPELKATATTVKAANPEMAKANEAAAKDRAAVNIAKAEKANATRAKIEKVKAEKAKAAAAKASAAKEAAEEVAVTPVLDTRQGSFNISSFEIYGNSLVTTAAIQKLLQPYIGAGKSYADLVDAKQKISQLYRNKGHKMVAIGMPAKIFGETIPVRIYEAKRSRASDLSMN
ncbi:POTRA domain-containing protein [Mariprofundus sp. KV]|uniref:POTRA domain-containing protein n=1 Tax=Mariprofundus sp. KV TaxID=2608715 RepID=UPI00159F73B5|nr:POTRA domain-containing protein [Mariprofundus sp. KV]NWF36432.1 hypothetical protein [Mariprofundus sp. KV]